MSYQLYKYSEKKSKSSLKESKYTVSWEDQLEFYAEHKHNFNSPTFSYSAVQ